MLTIAGTDIYSINTLQLPHTMNWKVNFVLPISHRNDTCHFIYMYIYIYINVHKTLTRMFYVSVLLTKQMGIDMMMNSDNINKNIQLHDKIRAVKNNRKKLYHSLTIMAYYKLECQMSRCLSPQKKRNNNNLMNHLLVAGYCGLLGTADNRNRFIQ